MFGCIWYKKYNLFNSLQPEIRLRKGAIPLEGAAGAAPRTDRQHGLYSEQVRVTGSIRKRVFLCFTRNSCRASRSAAQASGEGSLHATRTCGKTPHPPRI